MNKSVAIDGPAGAGKSTVAKKIAQRKQFIYVDTGAMYRAVGLFAQRAGVEEEEIEAILPMLNEIQIDIQYVDGNQRIFLGVDGEQGVFLNGENVNGRIRTEEVGNMASVTSPNPDVRKKLVELQQQLAKSADVVMDGRDIGTCVLPDADVKVYLTAGSAVRAKRRYEELLAKGEECDLAQIEKEIIERDERDMNRDISPLRQAEDAVLIDSSGMAIEEVVEKIIGLCS